MREQHFDWLEPLMKADIKQADKLIFLRAILLNEVPTHTEREKEMLASVSSWMLSLDEVPDEEVEGYCKLGEFASKFSEEEEAWMTFRMLRAQFLFTQRRFAEADVVVNELIELMTDNTQLLNMSQECKKHLQDGSKANPPQQTNQKPATPDLQKRTVPGCDGEFYSLISQLKEAHLDKLLSNAATWANKWVEVNHEYYGLLLKTYRAWYGVGVFGQDQGFINYFGELYQYWKQHADELIWLYEELADYRSKMALKTILQHWMAFHPDLRQMGRECQFEHYFDFDVIKCGKDEVFVDCGCFDGETVKDFIRCYGADYKRIYSYELTPSTYEVAKANLKGIPRLCLRNAGVSDQKGQFAFQDNGFSSGLAGANRLNAGGNSVARVVKIDDDIQEDITFIKMDIEGAECSALRGAEAQIRKNKPKLAISLYHSWSDLIEIPKIIKSFVPEYKLYLRQFVEKGVEDFPFPMEYVLLATTE